MEVSATSPEGPSSPTAHHSPDVPWLKRIMWVAVSGFGVLICLTGAQAYTSLTLRVKLDERDSAWQKRLDTLESQMTVLTRSVSLMQQAKLKQDQFNAAVIKMLEEKNGRTH